MDRRSDLGLDSPELTTKLMGQRNHALGPTSDAGMPILALLSNDDQLTETVQGAAGSEWSVVKPGIAFGAHRDGARGRSAKRGSGLVHFRRR